MNIAIIGYGKMGKEIEQIALQRGHAVKAIIDPAEEKATSKEISEKILEGIDVCIDFSSPESALQNIQKISSLGKNLVVGTTGWYEDMNKAKKTVEENKTGFIWASNFSIGVNAFYKIVGEAARIFNKIPEYDAFGLELHHKMKKDSPSGTAKSLGEIMLKNMTRKTKLVFDKLDRKLESNELHFASVRGGSIPGTHKIGFDSDADTIELTHTARNRKGFALGAVMAAEWLIEKKGFYSVNDFMQEILKG